MGHGWYRLNEKREVDTLPSGIRISTVFLELDHRFGDDGPPLVFETMAFPPGGWTELDVDRYATWVEAEAGHKAMMEKFSNETVAMAALADMSR